MFEESRHRLLNQTWSGFNTTERVLLLAGCAICAYATVVLSRSLDVPLTPKFAGSLVAGPSPVLAIITAAVVVALCTLFGAVVAAFLRLEAGLLCATVGLATLSIRGGPMHVVLQYASGPAVFLLFAFETLLLLALVWGAWLLLLKVFPMIWSSRLPGGVLSHDEDDSIHAEPGDIAFAVLAQAAIMIVCEMILLQTDLKKQTLASVGIAALLGTLAACQIAPLVSGKWYWLGPAIVGVIGYVTAYLSPQGWMIGEAGGTLSALSRATPLDYASLGTAGALIGYWTARKWKEESELGLAGDESSRAAA